MTAYDFFCFMLATHEFYLTLRATKPIPYPYDTNH